MDLSPDNAPSNTEEVRLELSACVPNQQEANDREVYAAPAQTVIQQIDMALLHRIHTNTHNNLTHMMEMLKNMQQGGDENRAIIGQLQAQVSKLENVSHLSSLNNLSR